MNDNDHNSGAIAATLLISALALFLSIVSLCRNGQDYISDTNDTSFVISVLSCLVTFLVGWQIWQFIASREEIKRVEKIGKRYQKIERRVELLKKLPEGFMYQSIARTEFSNKNYAYAFILHCDAISHLLKAEVEDLTHISGNLSNMYSCMNNLHSNIGDVWFYHANKDWIKNKLNSVEELIKDNKSILKESELTIIRIKKFMREMDNTTPNKTNNN